MAQSHLNVVPLRLLLVCVVACCLGPLYAMYPRAAGSAFYVYSAVSVSRVSYLLYVIPTCYML